MTKFKFGAYPKPWEISLSRGLSLILPFTQIGVFVYMVVLLCASVIIWPQIGILLILLVAIGFCYKNVQGVLGRVTDDTN